MTELTEMLRGRARAGLPPVEGDLRLPGLRSSVEILWDRWGVPHIYADRTDDMFFAQGYVLASERLVQIDLMTRLGMGRLAEAFGEAGLPLDRFIRTVGWNRAARRITQGWDDLSWEMAESSMAGARAWIARMPAPPVEYDLLRLDPFVPEGRAGAEALTAATILIAWGLSGNWDAELLRAEIAERLGPEAMAALFPDLPNEPPVVQAGKAPAAAGRPSSLDLLSRAPRLPGGQGSNNWVVAGRRSSTGMPLLANDPHLFVQLPSIWYEIHLSAPGYEARGVCLPFAPGVVIGHNHRIAWGITALSGDTQDLFLERLSDDGTAAMYEGEWEPLTIHREEIRVRGRSEPEVLEVMETRHGPILDTYLVGIGDPTPVPGGIRETYAIRWVGLEEGLEPSTLHRLNTAANFEEFRSALVKWNTPDLNFVYADVDGNIGYQAVGLHPIRARGDGTLPVPGWTREFEWTGFIPFEEMPWAYNPDEGFLVTANNKVHDDAYPHLIGKDFMPPFRARRIAQRLMERPAHDGESFSRIQRDTVSLPAMEMVPRLLEVEPDDERQERALALLAEWDFDLAPDSAAAALYEVWCCRIAQEILLPRLGEELFEHYHGRRQSSNAFQYLVLPRLLANPTAAWFGRDGREARDDALRRSLDEALEELTTAMGQDMTSWAWGAIHRVRFAGRLAGIPELAELFTGGECPLGGDEQTVNQGMFEPGAIDYRAVIVASWRQIIDLSDLDASVGTHTVGQSGNPASPHFKDLFTLWSTGRYHPLPFSRSAVEAQTATRLRLHPEK